MAWSTEWADDGDKLGAWLRLEEELDLDESPFDLALSELVSCCWWWLRLRLDSSARVECRLDSSLLRLLEDLAVGMVAGGLEVSALLAEADDELDWLLLLLRPFSLADV